MSASIIIADAGSTKTAWVLIGSAGQDPRHYTGVGINPVTMDPAAIEAAMAEAYINLGRPENVRAIYFYGAGCASPQLCREVAGSLNHVFSQSEISVGSDLLGAGRGLFGNDNGVACILGTGSNSCMMSDGEITANTPALGYIIGDEAGGAYLGKMLLNAVFKRRLSDRLTADFQKDYDLSMADMIRRVYREPGANSFLASFVPFIKRHESEPKMQNLVRTAFGAFFENNLQSYPGARSLPIRFTGSIALHFSDLLREEAGKAGYTIDRITQNPLDGLINYHLHETAL